MLLDHIRPTQTNFNGFNRKIVIAVAALVAGAMVLILAFVLVGSVRQDQMALRSSTRLAQTALAVKEEAIGRNLVDYAVWEDAYKNLHEKLDLAWAAADGNVGANIYNSLGYDMAFVINPAGQTVYSVLAGKPQTADAFALISVGLKQLVHDAANGEKPVVGLLRAGSDIAIVAANAILPPDGSAETAPPSGARSVLIFADKIDREFLSTMGRQYLLSNLALLGPGLVSAGATLPLASPDGSPLGQLTWTPERPGRDLLITLIPLLGIALVGLGAFALIVLWYARRSASAIASSAQTIQAYAQTLEASEARFRDVAEASSDWIWETDPELRFTYLSARFSEVTGVAAAAVLGKTLEQFFASDSISDGWSHLRGETSLHHNFRHLRCCYREASGSSRVCRLAGKPTTDHSGNFIGYRGTATDITSEVEAHEMANHLALHDPLTELPNRVLLRDRLDQALSRIDQDESHVAVLCLDLDHFKEVNDTLGHGIGDMVLRQVGERLREAIRATDTVARMGGDEFVVVQVAVNQPGEAQALCRRLSECFRAPFQIEGNELYVGVSIGVAVAPHDGTDHERLLKNADIALYRAKQSGRGKYRFFEHAMDSELQARKALEQDLRQAIAKGQLEMHYQPLVTIKDQQLTGVEALIRWRHPERGIIAPGEFIPIAEDTGLILPIGEWALRQACTDGKAWSHLRIAVNLSPVQFKHHELIEMISQVLAETEFPPERLELEITESVLLYDAPAALRILSAIKKLGIGIAMDDFGTGYSSLGYLNSFPFDKLKIDRSFIAELNGTVKANAIVKSVISLGDSLEMITTAEGVETLEQLTFLTEEGCQQVQGYYFGRAMPAAELTSLVADWQNSARDSAAAA